MKELSKSIVGVGQLAGGAVLGQLADIFGRKPVIIAGSFLIGLTGVGTAFSPWFPMFVVGQFLISALGMGVYLTVFILGTEYVGPTYRTASSILVMTGFSVGFVALSGIAYGLQGNWRHLQLVTGSVYFLFLAHCWLLPESARWLIQKKKYQKAESIIKKMAKINSALIPEKLFPDEGGSVQEPSTDNTVTVDIVKVKDRQNTMLDLFKTPKLRSRTLNLCFNWFTNSFVYYGISFNTDALHANPYVSSAILAAVEIPASLPAWWTIHKYGRRWPLCLSMALCGLFLSGSAFVSNPTAVIVLVVAAKCSNSVSFSTIFIFTAELFPTTVRNSGMGITSTLARFGTILSPYAMLLVNIWHPLPFFVMGLTSCLAGALGLLLPETLNCDLPDTLEEGETFGTNSGIGITSTLARFGTIVSPYAMLLVNIWHPLPFFVMGLTSCLAGALGLLLPETLNRDLPDTLEEGETFGTNQSIVCYHIVQYGTMARPPGPAADTSACESVAT